MTQPLDLYPPQRPLPAHRRARIRAVLMSTVAEPRANSRRSRRWVRATLVAGLVLGVALAVVQPWGRATAAWAAVPEQLDAGTTARLSDVCTEAIAQRQFPMSVSPTTPGLAEARGSSSAVISSSQSQLDVCITGPTAQFVGVYNIAPLPAGSIGVVDGVPGYRQGGTLRVIFGRLGVSVQGITVTTADGLHVTAAVGNGLFLAWWPSNADAVSVAVTLKSGSVQSLIVPEQAPPSPVQSSGF